MNEGTMLKLVNNGSFLLVLLLCDEVGDSQSFLLHLLDEGYFRLLLLAFSPFGPQAGIDDLGELSPLDLISLYLTLVDLSGGWGTFLESLLLPLALFLDSTRSRCCRCCLSFCSF
jgi:hypothetical protein